MYYIVVDGAPRSRQISLMDVALSFIFFLCYSLSDWRVL